jgi:hypothetical protein
MNPLSLATQKAMFYGLLALGVLLILSNVGWAGAYSRKSEQYETALTNAGRETANTDSAVSANDDWRQVAEDAIAERDACHVRETAADSDAKAALDQAQRADAAAQRKLDEFERRWSARSLHCGESLLAMENACATEFGEY